ncbi:MAG TPA: hypothetical protein VNA17_06260 [Pyrinomonadaceae bacterium]|nr:hypothetical protein [Pyrinomonadaceae bacterium]
MRYSDVVPPAASRQRTPARSRPAPAGGEGNEADILRSALTDWIDATNDRDIGRQMAYYMPQLRAYYLTRNIPVGFVRAEKERVFLSASSIDIAADEPEIVFQEGGQTAAMRFQKKYRVVDRKRTRAGEVIQELRWQRTNAGWRIASERDIRVLR